MNDYRILPSILAADHGQFVAEAKTVDIPEVEILHIDVMDGHFVPNITFGSAVVASLKKHTRFKLDVHLMIESVDFYIPKFAEAGADTIIIHQEATIHLQRSLALIRECGAKAGVAINPATALETLRWVFGEVDTVLIMTVNPGFGGQEFIQTSPEKIRLLRGIKEHGNNRFIIQVDGGIDEKTAPLAVEAGASYLVAGSSVFGKTNRPKAIRGMIASIEKHRSQKRTVYT